MFAPLHSVLALLYSKFFKPLYLHLCDCTKRLALPVSLIIADNCNALGLIPPPAGSLYQSVGSLMQITGALVKFLICHSLLLSLDEELADLSLPLAFSPYP